MSKESIRANRRRQSPPRALAREPRAISALHYCAELSPAFASRSGHSQAMASNERPVADVQVFARGGGSPPTERAGRSRSTEPLPGVRAFRRLRSAANVVTRLDTALGRRRTGAFRDGAIRGSAPAADNAGFAPSRRLAGGRATGAEPQRGDIPFSRQGLRCRGRRFMLIPAYATPDGRALPARRLRSGGKGLFLRSPALC